MLVNGRRTDVLPVSDRGLLYGDGVFETVAVRGARPVQLERHMRRLEAGCRRLGIASTPIDPVRGEAKRLARQTERAVLKIIITRGVGGRGYRADLHAPPTRIVGLHPWPDYSPQFRAQGIAATVCSTRLARNPALAGIKHLNRLEQVLARNEWAHEYQEGLVLDTAGRPVEGTMSNLFLVRDDTLLTPELRGCGVAGIMRERIMEYARDAGIPMRVAELGMEDVNRAQGLFFCNAIIGIWPVHTLGRLRFAKHPLIAVLVEHFCGDD
jgi:4-amino-4-deoxychorismate lyase